MGKTISTSDDNANDNDVVTTFNTIDKEDVGETGDETTDAEEVRETVSAADDDDDADDEDVNNNFDADGTFGDDDTDRD